MATPLPTVWRPQWRRRHYIRREAGSWRRLQTSRVFDAPPQMQQQELAQMRQRDANLTALAAIGPRKKRKLDSPGGTAAGAEVGRPSHTHTLSDSGGVSAILKWHHDSLW